MADFVKDERYAPPGTRLFTPSMVRAELGISESYYEKLISAAKLISSYQSSGKQRRFTQADIDRFKATWKKRDIVVNGDREFAKRTLADRGMISAHNSLIAFQESFMTYRDLGLNACNDCWMVTAHMLAKPTDCECYSPEGDCKLLAEMRTVWREKIMAENEHLRPTDIPIVQIYVRNLVVAFMCESYLSKRSILVSNNVRDGEKSDKVREYLKDTEKDIVRYAGILCLTPASRKKVGGGCTLS